MPERPPDLPDYADPPIDEVVIGIEFGLIPDFSQAHIGLLWSEIRDRYPKTEDQPPFIDPEAIATMQLQMSPQGMRDGLAGFPQSRTWFISDDDLYVLQIQSDRLIHNWRRRGDSPYPRFEPLVELVREHLERFQRVLESAGLAPVVPKKIEVTYINWIPDLAPSEFLTTARVPTTTATEVGDLPTQQQWSALYAIQIGERPKGSLNITCGPATRQGSSEQGQQFMLSMKQPVASLDDLDEVAGIARNVIVQTFTDLTTDEGHRRWGLIP